MCPRLHPAPPTGQPSAVRMATALPGMIMRRCTGNRERTSAGKRPCPVREIAARLFRMGAFSSPVRKTKEGSETCIVLTAGPVRRSGCALSSFQLLSRLTAPTLTAHPRQSQTANVSLSGTVRRESFATSSRFYDTSRRGVTTVFRASPEKLKVLAMNDLGEPSNATPAISDGAIFLRTDRHLYCIAEEKPR